MNGPASLVIETLAVVNIELTARFAVVVEGDEEGVWVPTHETAAAARAVLARDDVSTLQECRDLVERGGEGDGAAGANVARVGEVVVVGEAGREVDVYACGTLRHDGFDEQARVGEVELVFERETGFVCGVDEVVGAEDGHAGCVGGVEGGVEGWEEGVAEAEGLGYDLRVRGADEVRFAAAGVDVGVGAEEGVECAGLVPAG